MIRQAVVVAGGKGTRLGILAQQYGNKSLVPVLGEPLLCHTVRWLKEVGVEMIVVTVNYVAELRKVLTLFRNDTSVAVIGNLSRKNSAQCLPPIRGLLDNRFLFVYGHAPVPPEHLNKIASLTQEGVVASLYSTTTQRESTKKPAALHGSRIVFVEQGALYIEPPHILDHYFVELLARTESWKASFRSYQGPVFGVQTTHPPEFHYRKDFSRVRAWLTRRVQS